MRIGRSRLPARRATLFVLAVITTVLTPLAEGAPTTGFLGAPAGEPPSHQSAATRTVVMEAFTGTWCPPRVDASLAMKELESEYSRGEVVMVEYHFGNGGMGDPYEPKDSTSQERYEYYGGQSNVGAPGSVFDGDLKNVINGASSVQEAKAKYKSRIDAHLVVPAPVDIVAIATYSGPAASLSFTANPVGQLNRTDVRLRGILIENISTSSQGHWIGWVARATVMSEARSLAQSVTASSSFTLDAAWKPERLAVVAYVQDESRKSIHQGAFAALKQGNLTDSEPPVIGAVSHAPLSPTDQDRVHVTATITDNVAVASASLVYDAGAGKESSVLGSSGGVYAVEIGPFAAASTVTYHIEARDPAGNSASSSPESFIVAKAPAPDRTPPVASAPEVAPASPGAGDPVTVASTVTDDISIDSVALLFTDSAGGHTAPMSAGAGSRYSATIGPFVPGEIVKVKVSAKDTSGNIGSSTETEFKVLEDSLPVDLALTPTSMSLCKPSAAAGRSCIVTIAVRNNGPSTASRVVIRLSAGAVKIGDALVSSIPPGAESAASVKWTPSTTGKVELVAMVDPDFVQPDSDRANNVVRMSVNVSNGPGAGWMSVVDWDLLLIASLVGVISLAGIGVGLHVRRRRRNRRAGYDDRYPFRFR